MTGDLRFGKTEQVAGPPAPPRGAAAGIDGVVHVAGTAAHVAAPETAGAPSGDGAELVAPPHATGVRDQAAPPGLLRFEALVEHEFDVVSVVDTVGKFVFISASARTVFGVEPNDAVGHSIFDFLDPASVPLLRATFDDLVARRRLAAAFELHTARADGNPLVVEVMAANHLEDPIHGIVLSVRDITERRRREAHAAEVERRHAAIVDSLADGVMMVDAASVVVRVNDAFERLSGMPATWLVGQSLAAVSAHVRSSGATMVDADSRPVPDEAHPLLRCLATGQRVTGVVHGIVRAETPTRWVRINAQAMVDGEGAVTGAVASFSDITDARRSVLDRRREERFLQVLLDTLEEGIVACDTDGRITLFNPAARRLHGLDARADPIGKIPSGRGLLRVDGERMRTRENPLVRALSGERVREADMVIETRSGERRTVSVNGQRLVGEDGSTLGAVVAVHDVTERKRNEARLAELALHDPLTGLANRTLLSQRLREAIGRRAAGPVARRHTDATEPAVAVFLLDLDDFKEVNDRLGHDVGDEVLVAAARRLSAIVRPDDTVARLGGDEFVVVCEVVRGELELAAMTERIADALSAPYELGGRAVTVTASVGGVLLDERTTDPSALLSRADDAMYAVKWSRRRDRRPSTS